MSSRSVRDERRDAASAFATEADEWAQADQSRITAHFEAESPRWEAIYEANDVVAVVHQHRLAMALSWVDAARLPVGARVLEIGCGAGLASVALAERGFQVLATDISDVMLEGARERVQRAGLTNRVRVERADAHELRFAKGSFDMVMALGVLPWLHSPAQAAREMARVLRPGGLMVATIGNRRRLPWLLDPLFSPALAGMRRALKYALDRLGMPWRSPLEPHTHPLEEAQWRAFLNDAGFEIVRTTTFGFGPFTILGREILPDRISVSLHGSLQRLADMQVAVVRSTGAQHIALARKLGPREDPT